MTIVTHTNQHCHKALYQLCELEYKALNNYKNFISAVKKEQYKLHLIEFMADHIRSVESATHLLKNNATQIMSMENQERQSQSKQFIAKILTDYHHLKGLLINEVETNIMIKGLNSYPI